MHSPAPDTPRPDAARLLRRFFERRLSAISGDTIPRAHRIQHLVARTIRRAALDAATRPKARLDATEARWKRCLLVAALTELRTADMVARDRMP
jgi:hypothetical protein